MSYMELTHSHLFDTESQYEEHLNTELYKSPHVDLVKEPKKVHYNHIPNFLRFTGVDYKNKLALNSSHALVQNDSIELYYSYNGYSNWEQLTDEPVNVMFGETVFIKGDNDCLGTDASIPLFFMKGHFNVNGNIMSTVDSSMQDIQSIPQSYCFANLFYECNEILSTPELPANNLQSYCYKNMFYNCDNITTIPELHIHNNPTGGTQRMFYGCNNIKSITLPNDFYGFEDSEFQGCSLQTVFINSTTPPAINHYDSSIYPFNSGKHLNILPIYIPFGCYEFYKQSPDWDYYKHNLMENPNYWESVDNYHINIGLPSIILNFVTPYKTIGEEASEYLEIANANKDSSVYTEISHDNWELVSSDIDTSTLTMAPAQFITGHLTHVVTEQDIINGRITLNLSVYGEFPSGNLTINRSIYFNTESITSLTMIRKSVSTVNSKRQWVITLTNMGNLTLNNVSYSYRTSMGGTYSRAVSIGSLAPGINNIGEPYDITISSATSVSTLWVSVTWTNSLNVQGSKESSFSRFNI